MSGPGLEWYTWNARRDRDVGGEREGPPGTNPKVTRAPPSPRSPRGARARSRSASTFLRRVSPENAKWDNTAPTVQKLTKNWAGGVSSIADGPRVQQPGEIRSIDNLRKGGE
jgi:hypothetical protein